MKRQKTSDPLETLRKISEEMGTGFALRSRKQVRLLLIAPVLLNLILRLASADIWKPAQITLHILTAFWLLDWMIVILSAVTGVFAVPDIPARKRATILLNAIRRSYLQPQTAWAATETALRDAREANLGVRVLRKAAGLPNRIYHRAQELVAAGKAEEARFYVNSEIDTLNRESAIYWDLRKKARIVGCDDVVKPLLASGNILEAERIIVRANIVFAAVEELRIDRNDIIELVASGRLDEAEQWISRIRRDRERQSVLNAYAARIDATPIEHQGHLQRLLKELSENQFESRDFRMARHLLDNEIKKTERPPE